jgi:L-amino acid N-acyltransferase YncA
MKIRRAAPADAAAIASIYAPYVTATVVSFETEPPAEEEMAKRIAEVGDTHPWLVACEGDGIVTGYAYACAFRARPAYRFTVETTVYVADGAQRRGIGTLLYRSLLPVLERQGFAQAIAAITLPNEASVRLHEGLGFHQVGTYERVGFKFREWRSVGLWQRALLDLSTRPEEPRPVSAVWTS